MKMRSFETRTAKSLLEILHVSRVAEGTTKRAHRFDEVAASIGVRLGAKLGQTGDILRKSRKGI